MDSFFSVKNTTIGVQKGNIYIYNIDSICLPEFETFGIRFIDKLPRYHPTPEIGTLNHSIIDNTAEPEVSSQEPENKGLCCMDSETEIEKDPIGN